ncbi:MAG TPA: RHS repeat-associated core domain-containing protein, partial [Longimicrobium sp.]|nr:RHS repeat-associated core domain-containing protein [Longimicrobium sp.]
FTFGYDAAGRLVRVADAAGRATTIERTADGTPVAVVAPHGQRTALGVGAAGYLERIEGPGDGAFAMTYDAGGRLTSVTDPRGRRSAYAHDEMGWLLRAEDDEGGSKTVSAVDDGAGRTSRVETARGVATSYRYERFANGGVRRVRTGPAGLSVTDERAPDGTRTMRRPDGVTVTTRPAGDPRFGAQAPLAALTTVATPGGRSTTLAGGRRVTLADPADPFSVTLAVDSVVVDGRVHRVAYDAAAGTVRQTTPEGRVGLTRLGADRRPLEIRLPGVAPRVLGYDAEGRLASVSQDGRTTTMGYDALGRVDHVVDAEGRRVGYAYDAAGRLAGQTLPGGREVRFGWDARGNLVAVTPPGRPAHRFGYNGVNRIVEAETPGGALTRYRYDADRRLTAVLRPGGDSVAVVYDAAGRVSETRLARGAVTRTYDPVTGHLSGATGPDGSMTFAHDGMLPTRTTWSGAVSGSVETSYDASFRPASVAVNGAAVSLAHDRDGLLTQAGALSLQREVSSGVLTGTTLGGVTTRYTHNALGEVESAEAALGAAVLFRAVYTRDGLGRVTSATETVEGETAVWGYGYDAAGRLETVTRDGAAAAGYEYDANGNRTRATGPAGAEAAVHDADERLVSYGGATYTYRASGELATRTVAGATTTYDYDALGNLLEVALPGGRRIGYRVDAENRRIGRTVDGVPTQGFLWQGRLAPAAELDGAGRVVSRFVYATRANVPDYMVKEGRTYRIVTDPRGSVRLVVDAATGAVAQRLDYDAFGRVLRDSNPGFQPFGFAGGLYDAETGLVRFGVRDYDAHAGRWTARDPIGFAGGDYNLYAYVRNDPVNFVDPSGLEPLSDCVKDFLRNFLEDVYPNVDLDRVDIHVGEDFPFYSEWGSVDPSAFTSAYDIYFREGGYDPGSAEGLALLMHELLHTQQYMQEGPMDFRQQYLRESFRRWRNDQDPYWDNRFEVDAHALQELMERYIRDAYGNQGPCPDECPR